MLNEKQTMKTKDLLTIATAALGTATLTVAAFWVRPLDAGNDADAPPPKLAKSLLISHGVELALAPAGGRAFKAGDQPELALTAINSTSQPASASVCVTMTASAPADRLSRVIRLPSVLWRQEQIVSLQPNETKVYALSANTNLPPKSVISVSLQDLEQKSPRPPAGIVALSFSTTIDVQAPTVASAR
jgi:hypothetical protein